MQICRLVILDQQNLFLLISARITIYDLFAPKLAIYNLVKLQDVALRHSSYLASIPFII